MKVLLFNGSPHTQGCTYTALCEVGSALMQDGIETEIIQVGAKPIGGCIGCGYCYKSGGKCVFTDDCVNEMIEKIKTADGFIFGSPVHYAAPAGNMVSFLHRLCYAGGGALRGKPGAAVVSCRRAGSSAALDQLQKYFSICGMPMVPSQYWPMVHGANAEEVKQDLEGLQTMRLLGHNMAWMLKCFELGRENGLDYPQREDPRIYTNFIR